MRKKTSSPPAPPPEHLDVLRELPREVMASLLAELAAAHPEVAQRLARHALAHDPARLAKMFRARLQGRTNHQSFRHYSTATHFGRDLEAWLGEVERELFPLDPVRAHDLADAFLANDACFFEEADDSDGAIGDAVRAGCRLWLRTAKAQCYSDPSHWIERVYALMQADDYGAREALLAHADLLFDETGLRRLARRFEPDLEQALRAREAGQRDYGLYKASAAIGLIADALCDPDLSTQTTLRISPQPNVLQKERIAERYLHFGRPHEALAWLDGHWENHEDRRERLLADVHGALGDTARLSTLRQTIFERTGATADFEAWRQSLAPAAQTGAVEVARQRANTLDDPIAGANLLLALDDDADAQALLLARRASVRGDAYYALLPLAQVLEQKGRLPGAVVCYRALLTSILARGYAKAYGHGVDYLQVLRRLDTQIMDYGPLDAHQAFELQIRRTHARKFSFWNRTVPAL